MSSSYPDKVCKAVAISSPNIRLSRSRLTRSAGLLFLVLLTGRVDAQIVTGCGSLANAYGPFDYRERAALQHEISLVEQYHFSGQTEALRSHNAISDIDYTLRAFPNHYRALNSVGKYQLLGGRSWSNPSVRSADCYFKRAIAFATDDSTAIMLYANFLTKKGEKAEARKQYEAALALDPKNPELNYNFGLYCVHAGEIECAKRHADIAYAAGYPLQGLKKMINKAERR